MTPDPHTESGSDLHIAADTGGTFTDIGIRLPGGGLAVWKVASTPDAPDDAVIEGVTEALRRQDGDPADVTRLVHGTTVATNTVLTRDGARVGLVTTRGFRDVLAIAHQARPSLYDNTVHRAQPLIGDDAIVEVDERVGSGGDVIAALDEGQLKQVAEELRALGLDSLVVSFINAYSNDEHERRAVEILRRENVAPIVVAATSISAEMREYDRTSTAAINAYVQPKVAGYMGRLEERIEQMQIPSQLWIMQSNGGLLNPVTASEHSARTVLSGLAGGVAGASRWARHLELDNVVSFDIGGTSTDIALIRGGEPDETTTGEIDSMPLRLPSIDLHTIGAGGGSIAWRDSGGSLRVGPHSAGADPGPIAYRRGGTELTVTDAHVALGRLGTELLGGEFTLDVETVNRQIASRGEEMGLDPQETAEGIIKVITATMARGIRKVSVERGIDVRSCHLMAFGGAGPLHGADLAHELGMRSVVIPPHPGIASAVGMLDAPVRHDFAAPVHADAGTGLGDLPAEYRRLEQRAEEEMGTADFEGEYLVDARYVGQSYELTIPFLDDFDAQLESFHAAHERRYGFRDEDAAMEIIVVRLIAVIGHDDAPQELHEGSGPEPEPTGRRDVYVDGRWLDVPLYDRAALPPNSTIAGPAILNQFDTTTYVRPDQDCRCDAHGFLHLTPRKK
ncbi:N-methylhydaintoinase A [Corynebacterium maris DSM 45190]|uniref:N-methylhydaintoinase A n=1 Tax=Corynebacterium maris DSM 45190 TaxID=1224163 RepID=S5SXA1_9CORY|nr:hydantoinase/oxoprolinase family protein [Corynebacterium maris]AGS35752.1 N-methylhydaintoinase A [Corynebacterium maris DSM 45190]